MHNYKTINVAYVTLAPFISGSERCLQLIIKNAKTNGIKPILITPYNSPLRGWCSDQGIKHYSVDISLISLKTILFYAYNQLKLVWILKKEHIQIIHSNQIWNFKVFDRVSAILKIKRVCHFRDPIRDGSKWWLPKPADLSIFISKHIESEFKSIFDLNSSNRTLTLLDLVDFDNTSCDAPSTEKTNNAKKRFKLTNRVFVFGFIGQIAPVKGVVELLYILNKLENKNWTLLIAGKDQSNNGAYLKKCIQVVSELELKSKVHFCGFLDSTDDFYLACDIIIVFSLEEPLGLVPLEAALFHTPTVANAVGGLPETIINEETGFLVNIHDQDNVVRLLERSMREDLSILGLKARRYVESQCSPRFYMMNLRKCYEHLLKH